jgi:hypothetical protein
MGGLVVRRGENDFESIRLGRHSAVCVNYFDLGLQRWDNQIKPKVALLFEIDDRRRNQQRFQISKEFTASLGAKATLRAFLESWRGRPFTEAELDGFNLDNIVNGACELYLGERTKPNGSTFIEIEGITRLTKWGERLIAETAPDYIPNWVKRKIDNQIIPGYPSQSAVPSAPADEYLDEVPF